MSCNVTPSPATTDCRILSENFDYLITFVLAYTETRGASLSSTKTDNGGTGEISTGSSIRHTDSSMHYM